MFENDHSIPPSDSLYQSLSQNPEVLNNVVPFHIRSLCIHKYNSHVFVCFVGPEAEKGGD